MGRGSVRAEQSCNWSWVFGGQDGAEAVIRYDDVMSLLFGACPSYAVSDEAASHDNRNGHYILMEYFVTHLIRLLEVGHTDSFPAVFGVAERVLLEGDGQARGLVTYGFLEDLTSAELFYTPSAKPSDFLPWFGSQACRDHHVRRLMDRRRPSDPSA